MSDSVQPFGLKPSGLLCSWDSPGKNLEWVAISFSGASSQPRSLASTYIGTQVQEPTAIEKIIRHIYLKKRAWPYHGGACDEDRGGSLGRGNTKKLG